MSASKSESRSEILVPRKILFCPYITQVPNLKKMTPGESDPPNNGFEPKFEPRLEPVTWPTIFATYLADFLYARGWRGARHRRGAVLEKI